MSKKLRIAHLSLLAPPGQTAASGVPKVCETLLRQYEKFDDISVDAVTLVDGLERYESRSRGAVTYHYHPCKAKGKTWTFYVREVSALRRIVRELAPDIVHAHPNAENLMAATSCGLPHVVTLHGLIQREAAGLGLLDPVAIASKIRDYCQLRALRSAKNLICLSDYVREYAQGKTSAQIWPVPNPIDADFFDRGPLDPSGLRILCAGVVSHRKNQLQIVRACAILKSRGVPFEFRMLGPITDGADVPIRELIVKEDLQNSVKIKGLVPFEELCDDYSWCSATVLASREETMPLSLMQAMAAGRPVFGARAGGIPVLLAEGKLGSLFESAEELAAHLEAYHRNPSVFSGKAVVAGGVAEAQFHPEAVARRTVDIYREIAKPR